MTEVEICNLALSGLGANTITSLSANASKEDRLCNRWYSVVRDEVLSLFQWNFATKTARLIRTDLYDTTDAYSDIVTITNVATSNPIVITAANQYATGMMIKLYDVVGTTELNDLTFEVAAPNTATFALLGVDGGKYTAYTSGGKAVRVEPLAAYSMGYTYDLPTDFLKAIRIDDGEFGGAGYPFQIFGDTNGQRLVTTNDSPVLQYICQITDTTKFTQHFINLLVIRLQSVLSVPLLGAKDGYQIKRAIMDDVSTAFSIAKRIDCQGNTKSYVNTYSWISARK